MIRPEKNQFTLDHRHQQPVGTTALPSQACSATFKQTVIQTVEDLQERQGSVYNENSGFSFDGSELAEAIPDGNKDSSNGQDNKDTMDSK